MDKNSKQGEIKLYKKIKMLGKKLKSTVWDGVWKSKVDFPIYDKDYENTLSEYNDIFKKYLKNTKGKKFIEIGCAPGGILFGFKKKFGFEISGVEYSTVGIDNTKKNFKALGIETDESNIYKEDFTKLSKGFLDKNAKSYDVVFSAGFVEHFVDLDSIMDNHKTLLKNTGIAIIHIPQFSWPYKLLGGLLAPRGTFFLHNWKICNYKSYKKIVEKHFDIIEFRPQNISFFESYMVKDYKIIYNFFKLLRKIGFISRYIESKPKTFSPGLFFVGKLKTGKQK